MAAMKLLHAVSQDLMSIVCTYLHISGPTSLVRGNSVHLDNLCVLYNTFFFSLDNVDDQINSLFFRIVIN